MFPILFLALRHLCFYMSFWAVPVEPWGRGTAGPPDEGMGGGRLFKGISVRWLLRNFKIHCVENKAHFKCL